MQNIVLIGFMGSGKSAIGKRLAKELGLDFIDSDKIIAKNANKSINQIFSEFGEAHFRALEAEFIKEYKEYENLVIATGGGMSIHNDISELGVRFYLNARFDVIFMRISGKTHRPLFTTKEQTYQIFKERKPIYEKHCDFKINTNAPIKKIVHKICQIIDKSLIKSHKG
ncbi:MAG: shikimate kinase [Helicobacter sp.]|nr:shikimate kinase [Helicobacter sp.]